MEDKDLKKREEALQKRLDKLLQMEKEIKAKEKALKAADGAKKQLLLRLSSTLWEDISRMAEEDFRSINGEIEFLLTDAVKRRKG